MEFTWLLSTIQNNIEWAPWLIFFLLLLAGFNIPVSEDAMIFIAAMLASKNPDQLVPLILGLYGGIYLSDLISYGLGRFLGNKLWDIKFFAKMVSKEKFSKLQNFYQQYGTVTLIFGRFIPFGVRNALFLTAGIGKMNPVKFALSDFVASALSTAVFFYLYYTYGQSMIELIKKGNVVIFSVAILVVGFIWIRKKRTT